MHNYLVHNVLSYAVELQITDMHLYDISNIPLFGHLHQIIILNTKFENLRNDFLDKLYVCLVHLTFEFVPEYLNMDLMFSSSKTNWAITDMALKSKHSQMRTIAASNFTRLPCLRQLVISASSVETILDDAFDYLKNLRVLNLAENNIKVLPVETFNRLIDRTGIGLTFTIGLHGNPFECTCETKEWRSIVELNEWEGKGNIQVYMPCGLIADRHACPNMQTIREPRICLPSELVHSYSKFVIKVDSDRDELIVTAPSPRKYRLFVQHLMNENEFNSKWGAALGKCPKKGFLEKAVTCLLLRNEQEALSLARLSPNAAIIRIICINYVTGGWKRFWPLHCLSHRQRVGLNELETFMTVQMCLLTVFLGCLGLFLMALTLVLHMARKMKPQILKR